MLLHAFPLTHAMWAGSMERFGSRVRVIAPDLPGFGRSPRLPRPSIPAMADAVSRLVDTLSPQPVILAGLSMGGYVAFEFARQHPERVKALGLFSTRAAPDTAEQRDGRLQLIERIRTEGVEILMRATLPKLLGRTTMAQRQAVVATVEQAIRSADPHGVSDALQAMAERPDARPLLASITCSTLVIAGAEDSLIPAEESDAMARAIPHATLEIIPAAGHLVNLEAPDRFHDVVESWLRHVSA